MLSFDLELDGLSPEPVTKQSFSPPRPAGSGQSDYCNQRRDGDVHLLTPNPMNDSLDRRNFLKQAGAAGIGLGMAGYFSPLARASVPATAVPARKISANDTITAAVICRGQFVPPYASLKIERPTSSVRISVVLVASMGQ